MAAETARDHDAELMESLALREWEVDPQLESLSPEMMASPEALEAGRARESSADGRALWYPKADRTLKMPTRGRYAKGYPVGMVVHFTAGHRDGGEQSAIGTVKYGAGQGHNYFCMSKAGKVYQTAPLDQWGSHAGESSYPGLGSSLSAKLAGIEVCGAGLLTKTSDGRYVPSWNKAADPKKTIYAEADVRFAKRGSNVTSTGFYLAYTPEQEASLIDLILWLHLNNPAVFKIENVVGHDEIAPSRKNDPGGSLSMNMPAFREELRQILRLQGNLAKPAPDVPADETSPPPGATPVPDDTPMV